MSGDNSANKSYLSSSKYGYDFVVATTQASINSNLREYLGEINQPATTLCFLADDKGNPSVQISLKDLMAKAGGVDPFSIPKGTDYSDKRITAMTDQRFMVGLKVTLGLPPGLTREQMRALTIVDLGTSANNVTFNLYCSEFQLIQNTPPGGWSGKGSWDVWIQPDGTPWFFSTTVNLVVKDLDNELNTPYFNSHPKQKAALIKQLNNLGSMAFSLQQLLFDLDNAAVQSLPKIEGLDPGSNAGLILTKSFLDVYFASAKEHGAPLLSVHAVTNPPGSSTLALTSLEREVGQFIDQNGEPVAKPTAAQKQVVTLDYLCAANHNPLPGAATFNWNWVDLADVDNESGTISINRNTLANHFKTDLWQELKNSCIGVTAGAKCEKGAWFTGDCTYSAGFAGGKTPKTCVIPATGAEVLKVHYDDYSEQDDKDGATYCQTKLWSTFDCSVSFSGNEVTIVQHLVVTVYVEWDDTGETTKFFDKAVTDVYTLSIDQDGLVVVSKPASTTTDNSMSPDRSWLVNLFTGVNDIVNHFKKDLTGYLNASITDIPASNIQNFVFPGANVFVYKDVKFSEYQDLITSITYTAPSP